MISKLDIVTASGVPMRLVHLPDGQSEARPQANKYRRDERAIVEVFDRRYPHTSEGQFVCEYYVADLFEPDRWTSSLRLYGDTPDWTIDVITMNLVNVWLENLIVNPVKEDA